MVVYTTAYRRPTSHANTPLCRRQPGAIDSKKLWKSLQNEEKHLWILFCFLRACCSLWCSLYRGWRSLLITPAHAKPCLTLGCPLASPRHPPFCSHWLKSLWPGCSFPQFRHGGGHLG